MKKYSLYILFLMGLGAMAGSCTNLDEKIYDRLVDNNFYKNEKDIIAAITPVYTDYRGLLEWRKWWDFEETTDVAVTPRAAWFDGGIYIRLHKHTWKPEDPHFSDLWGQAYGGISNCNRVIYQLDNLDFEVTASESGFYKCIADVIEWYKMYPDDWKRTWFEIQKHHAEEIGCPDGVFHPLDIDAKINAAYIVLGLLYGNGDFTKTMEISTRAGQDSDCNPSSAGGILGTMIGYDAIPEYWMKGLRGAEGKNFKYTLLCLDQIYTISNKHALEMIRRNGGKVEKENVTIAVQRPETVRLEQSFTDMYPTAKVELSKHDIDILTFEFEGTGFVLRGEAIRRDMNRPDAVLKVNLYLDGELVEKAAAFPTYFHDRRLDIFWKYQLPEGKHQVKVEVIKDGANALLKSWDYIVYSKGKK